MKHIERNGSIWYSLRPGPGELEHRVGSPAAIYPPGSSIWRIEGRCYRKDGPALLYPGGESWYCFGDGDMYPPEEVWSDGRCRTMLLLRP
jgi:hypothetical protein